MLITKEHKNNVSTQSGIHHEYSYFSALVHLSPSVVLSGKQIYQSPEKQAVICLSI
jgi:hypothetical protein